LQVKQQAFLDNLSATLNRPLDVMARMQHALNAVIVRLDSAEASAVMKRPDVLFIEREHLLQLDTDRGPAFIGAPAIWGGMTASGVATKGEGILFGDIDSGINWESPAFAAVGPIDGYAHQNPLGAGNYLGQCAPGGVDAGKCNDKLIGIYNFAAPGTTGTDIEGHGSHTASTVAGNQWNAVYASGPFTISGVAPHANVIAYLACPTTSCPSTATSQSANQAVVDGVDVINYSISGGTSPWTDATSTAFRNAVAGGAFVAASAGNTSTSVPNPQGQVNHMEPWVETVAASTEDRILAVSLDLTSEASPPANTQDIPMRPGGAPLPTENLVDVPLIKSPNFANGSTDGCAAYPANTFVRTGAPTDRIFFDGFDSDPPPDVSRGAVAVLHLDGTASSCGSGTRRANALAAGAVGVIFVDAVYLNLGAADTSWSMLMSDWTNLEAGSNPATATVSIDIAARAFPGPGDQIASFSFRGPRLVGGQGMVKPDITAPGVDILAVGASSLVGPNGVILLNGTSMS
ncbi:MAG: S8 family serine peptidase, partial [Xanthomonadales bacterium]|nr:S8 family serine peptidase [Xanthomonadales bacterium]